MKKGLFAKKSIGSLLKEAADNKHGLKRALGPMNLIAMGIGAIIGAGLFVLTGEVAANNAGPAVVLSFIIAAIIANGCRPLLCRICLSDSDCRKRLHVCFRRDRRVFRLDHGSCP